MSLFSIVVPTHDRPKLLQRLLDSIARQTMRDFEAIVVDDASPDRAAYEEVVERSSRRLALRYLRNEENRGSQYSRNRGVAEANGELIAFVDDDDEWLPRKLERQAAVFGGAGPRLGLVYTWADGVSDDGVTVHEYRSVLRGQVLPSLLGACFIPSPTVAVRRGALEDVGPFDESLPSCQDWDMWTRIAAAGYDIDLSEEVLAIHHRHRGPSIGTSPRSIEGYRRFYSKHEPLYRRARMQRELSEKYRALAHHAVRAGDRHLAGEALRRAVGAWAGNWKAWVRYGQLVLRGGRG